MNFHDSKKNSTLKGINISIHEVDGRNKTDSKPQYGTENMSHIIALLNDKKNYHSNSNKSKRNTSNHVSMKKLTSINNNMNKSSY